MNSSKDAIKLGFGVLLRRRRTSKGLSQEDLGLIVGLDRTYISGIERGVRNPSLTVLFQIAQGLNLNLAGLVAGVEKQIAGGTR